MDVHLPDLPGEHEESVGHEDLAVDLQQGALLVVGVSATTE